MSPISWHQSDFLLRYQPFHVDSFISFCWVKGTYSQIFPLLYWCRLWKWHFFYHIYYDRFHIMSQKSSGRYKIALRNSKQHFNATKHSIVELKNAPHETNFMRCTLAESEYLTMFQMPLTIQLKWFSRWAFNLRFDSIYEFHIFSVLCIHVEIKNENGSQFNLVLCVFDRKKNWNAAGRGLSWIEVLVCFGCIL